MRLWILGNEFLGEVKSWDSKKHYRLIFFSGSCHKFCDAVLLTLSTSWYWKADDKLRSKGKASQLTFFNLYAGFRWISGDGVPKSSMISGKWSLLSSWGLTDHSSWCVWEELQIDKSMDEVLPVYVKKCVGSSLLSRLSATSRRNFSISSPRGLLCVNVEVSRDYERRWESKEVHQLFQEVFLGIRWLTDIEEWFLYDSFIELTFAISIDHNPVIRFQKEVFHSK